jgi:D-amino-acid dehydrogenase
MGRVVIIGGGISGLMSAYYLNKAGHKVSIVDKSNFSDGCSHGNAGLIVPSHIVPLAAPGVISMGLKWMLDPSGPFSFTPSFNKELFSWAWNFYKAANKKHTEKSKIPLRDFNLFSKELYQDLSQNFDFYLKNFGLLVMFKNESTGIHEIETALEAKKIGLDLEILSGDEVQKLENIKTNVAGAVHYKCDSHIYPNKLISLLIQHLKKNEVEFIGGKEIVDFEFKNGKIESAITKEKKIEADYFVLSSGVWSQELTKKLNISLPLQSGKGYSITLENSKLLPKFPSLLIETRAAVTPMGKNLRLAGTMELGSNDEKINLKRVNGFLGKIKDYYPELGSEIPEQKKIWFGHRPCSPDGLPYIGRSKVFNNLIYATGHAMLGLSMAPATGKVVQEIIDNKKTSINLAPFNPERYNGVAANRPQH